MLFGSRVAAASSPVVRRAASAVTAATLVAYANDPPAASLSETEPKRTDGEKKNWTFSSGLFDVSDSWIVDARSEAEKFLGGIGGTPSSSVDVDPQKGSNMTKVGGDNSEDTSSFFRSFASLISGRGKEADVMLLIDRARKAADASDMEESRRGFLGLVELTNRIIREVNAATDRAFGHLDLAEGLDPTALFYFLEREDEKKNPSWKRRMHRYHRGVDVEEVIELNRALALADLSYEDTADEVKLGLEESGENWELVYCKTKSQPTKPGHFLAVKKDNSRWSSALDVLLVVRGTKDVPDLLTNALCEASDYRGGKVHDGCLRAGMYLVEKHGDLLDEIQGISGRRRINLTIIG